VPTAGSKTKTKKMQISGFTMVKNATKLYYPIREAILSILPIVDEFVVALGDCDADDHTREAIESIQSDKIKIIDTVWDLKKYPNGTENAHQTDLAKSHCTGDWVFYLQADEVIHEQYLPVIKKQCEALLNDPEVEGLLFNYIHFWGDYDHYQNGHGWYKNEIRIVRNSADIHSWESAQSFRRIPGFDGKNYRQQEGTFKLKVVKIPAYVYHYGWVRPPHFMQNKKKALDTIHKGKEKVANLYKDQKDYFEYGPLGQCAIFSGTHPKVMAEFISKFDWAAQLNYSKKEIHPNRKKQKHEKLKYRVLSFFEQKVFGGREIGGFKNYLRIKR
jgi:hypothetical protein